MILSVHKKDTAFTLVLFFMAALMLACQPSATTETASTEQSSDDNTTSPIIIDADSVTMGAEHILIIKPSRYQPSLGLQGKIEPIKQIKITAAQDVLVQDILVTKGQWVEQDTPLLTLKRQTLDSRVKATDVHTNITDSTPQSQADTLALQTEPSIKSAPNDNMTRAPTVSNTHDITTDRVKNDISEREDANEDSSSITIRAGFSGRVGDIYVGTEQRVARQEPLLYLSDDSDLQFVATLPIQAKSQLSVGQAVNFLVKDMSDSFIGQVSRLESADKPNNLLVYVQVNNNEVNHDKLKPKMSVIGRVDYGQMEVGNLVPARAIHDADLSALKAPPYKPLIPLTANVWIVKQDQRLSRLPVQVIEYDPNTDKYLIAGISNDSLICLADLPVESAGKKITIS